MKVKRWAFGTICCVGSGKETEERCTDYSTGENSRLQVHKGFYVTCRVIRCIG